MLREKATDSLRKYEIEDQAEPGPNEETSIDRGIIQTKDMKRMEEMKKMAVVQAINVMFNGKITALARN